MHWPHGMSIPFHVCALFDVFGGLKRTGPPLEGLYPRSGLAHAMGQKRNPPLMMRLGVLIAFVRFRFLLKLRACLLPLMFRRLIVCTPSGD